MAEELDGEGEIVVIAHDSKSETALIRENVFAETIQSSYPQFQVAAYRMDEMQRTVADEINEGKYLASLLRKRAGLRRNQLQKKM